jgi:hypothetical protein
VGSGEIVDGGRPLRLTPRDRLLRTITEKEWSTTVIEIARLNRWLIHHSRPAWVREGRMVTALSGHAGLPDLIMVKPPRMVVVELKTETGVLSDEQRNWLQAFAEVPGCRAFVWRPSDLDTVWRVLST